MIVLDAPTLEQVIRRLERDGAKARPILRRLIKTQMRIARTDITRACRTQYAVKAKRVLGGLIPIEGLRERRDRGRLPDEIGFQEFGLFKKGGVSLDYLILAKRWPIGLQNFESRQSRAGLHVRIKVGGNRRIIPRAFMAPASTGNSNKIPWQRTGEFGAPKKGRYKGRKITRGPLAGSRLQRERLRVLFGPSVADMVVKQPVREQFVSRFRERGDKEARRIAAAFGV